MKRSKPQPEPADAPDDLAKTVLRAAFGAWMMSNVRREIAAGRVRTTVDEHGVEHAIN